MILPLEELKKHEWSVSWSGGKDSTATIILMHRYGVPIKSIDYVRMMYNDEKARGRNNWVQDYDRNFAELPSYLPKRFFEDEEGEQETFFY